MRENIVMAGAYTEWHIQTGGYAKDMTLRDHFAGLAMQGLMANGTLPKSVSDEELADVAYMAADEMLKERNFEKKKNTVEDKLHSMKIDELPMTTRAVNCLHAGNIKTVGDLLKTTRWDLMKIPNLGRRSILEIIEVLAELNLKLREM